MFEFLAEHQTNDVVEAAYYAARLITHRAQYPPDAAPVEPACCQPSPLQIDFARQIIEKIERAESVPLEQLSEDRASDYLGWLYDLADERVKSDVGDVQNGEKLLKELRESSDAPKQTAEQQWVQVPSGARVVQVIEVPATQQARPAVSHRSGRRATR